MPDIIIIRNASENDCRLLPSIIQSVVNAIPYYNDFAKQSEIAKFGIADLLTKRSIDEYSVVVASVNDEIAGFCLSRYDDQLIWLEWFAVLESYRGKGISKLLLDNLDKTVALRNCHKVWCDCRTDNIASIHILAAHGFSQLVTLRNHWYGQDFILWEKDIG